MSMGYLAAIRAVEQHTGAQIGLSVRHAAGGWQIGYGEQKQWPLASLAKLLTAVAYLRTLDRNGEKSITAEVRELVIAAVSRHDRAASCALTARAGGLQAVNELLRDEGFHQLHLTADHASRENCGTPRDLTLILQRILCGELLSAHATALILEAMRGQTDPDGLRSGLPVGVSWAHMTGGLDDVCNDMGFLEIPSGQLLCAVCVTGSLPWPQLEQAVSTVGELTYAFFGGEPHA